MSVPRHKIFSQRTLTTLAFFGDSIAALRETLDRSEAREAALERQRNINRDNWTVVRKIDRQLDDLRAAMSEVRAYITPSSVGSPFGGEGVDTRASVYGLEACSAADCPEFITRQEAYQQCQLCAGCWKKANGGDPDAAIRPPTTQGR